MLAGQDTATGAHEDDQLVVHRGFEGALDDKRLSMLRGVRERCALGGFTDDDRWACRLLSDGCEAAGVIVGSRLAESEAGALRGREPVGPFLLFLRHDAQRLARRAHGHGLTRRRVVEALRAVTLALAVLRQRFGRQRRGHGGVLLRRHRVVVHVGAVVRAEVAAGNVVVGRRVVARSVGAHAGRVVERDRVGGPVVCEPFFPRHAGRVGVREALFRHRQVDPHVVHAGQVPKALVISVLLRHACAAAASSVAAVRIPDIVVALVAESLAERARDRADSSGAAAMATCRARGALAIPPDGEGDGEESDDGGESDTADGTDAEPARRLVGRRGRRRGRGRADGRAIVDGGRRGRGNDLGGGGRGRSSACSRGGGSGD